MNHTFKNLAALVLFIISLTFLLAASSMQNNSVLLLQSGDCYHCGTAGACETGGQAYGYFNCIYNDGANPPNNCTPYGYGCGGVIGEN